LVQVKKALASTYPDNVSFFDIHPAGGSRKGNVSDGLCR
jgi:hypothetical protein